MIILEFSQNTGRQQLSFFDFSGFFPLPLWKLLLDAGFALIMWALLVRFAVVVLFGDAPPVALLRSALRLTDRLMRAFRYVTPRALAPAAHGLYAAFFVFLLRYYGLPAILDWGQRLASLPAEAKLKQCVFLRLF